MQAMFFSCLSGAPFAIMNQVIHLCFMHVLCILDPIYILKSKCEHRPITFS